MNKATNTFDELINMLDESINPTTSPSTQSPDAIDRINAAKRRTTNVISLRDDPDIQQFRDDLKNGLIRLDAANNLFALITRLLQSTGRLQ